MRSPRDSSDDLLVIARRGDLPEPESQRLRDVLAASPEAQMLYDAGRAFDREGSVVAGDDERVARIAERVRKGRPGRRGFVARVGRVAPAAAAALLATGVAVGALAIVHGHIAPTPSLGAVVTDPAPMVTTSTVTPTALPITSAPSAVAPAASAVPSPPQRAERRPAAPPSALAAPGATRDVVLESAPPRPLDDGMDDDVGRTVPSTPTAKNPTAPELFAAASAARVRGDAASAMALLGQLERQYPSSNEATTAHLSLGVLLLQSGQAGAALDEFRRYGAQGVGPAAPEALWGESQALHDLGRSSDERAALEELLRRYPQSAYAGAAAKRLERLP